MFLTHILPVFLFAYRGGYAIPVYCTPSSNATSLSWGGTLAVIDSTDPRQPPRTLYGVAWSCVLTVFICAWTSVHPNVPPRDVTGGLLARVKLMFWTIVAPELVLAWAVRQWFAARVIRDAYNQHMGTENQPSKRWTKAHGHLLGMGGFRLVSDKIHQLKEPAQPRSISTGRWRRWRTLMSLLMSRTVDSDRKRSEYARQRDEYARKRYEYVRQRDEYVRERERCHLGTLTFERFEELILEPNVFPAVTPAQIQDRSKGDGLSKLLAILQTSWFILQCIARGFQGLALTELELVTLAMASLNAITFAFWWSKPLGVQEPVDVYVKVPEVVEAENANRNTDADDNMGYTARDIWIIADPKHFAVVYLLLPVYLLTFPVFVLFPLGILFLLWIIKAENVEEVQDDKRVARVVHTIRKLRYDLTHSIRQYFGGQHGPLRYIFDPNTLFFIMGWFFVIPASFFLLILLLAILSPLFAIFVIASFTFTAAFEIVTTNKVPPGATHVPPFYAPHTESDRYSRMIVFAIFGVVFGSIHCIAWNFAFPTHTERSLWRYTSLVLTAVPPVAALIDCILENCRVTNRLRLFLSISLIVLLFLYVPARLALISLALASLRKQPDTAYIAVNWTKYIPHLFS